MLPRFFRGYVYTYKRALWKSQGAPRYSNADASPTGYRYREARIRFEPKHSYDSVETASAGSRIIYP